MIYSRERLETVVTLGPAVEYAGVVYPIFRGPRSVSAPVMEPLAAPDATLAIPILDFFVANMANASVWEARGRHVHFGAFMTEPVALLFVQYTLVESTTMDDGDSWADAIVDGDPPQPPTAHFMTVPPSTSVQ